MSDIDIVDFEKQLKLASVNIESGVLAFMIKSTNEIIGKNITGAGIITVDVDGRLFVSCYSEKDFPLLALGCDELKKHIVDNYVWVEEE
jgi:hypothetical protein